MPVLKDFALPDLGEGLTESELVSWHVAVGETVELNQIIAEVETAKALVELPSPYAGVIARLYVEPGVTVAVGDPIVSFEVPGDEPRAPAATGPAVEAVVETAVVDTAAVDTAVVSALPSAAPASATAPDAVDAAAAPLPNLVGYGPGAERSGHPARRRHHVDVPTDPQPVTSRAVSELSVRPVSTPPVRKRAHDLGIDLASIPGTGVHGIVTRDDLERFVSGRDDEAPAPLVDSREPAPRERETRIPIKGVRKSTADAMVRSAFTAPHASASVTVDVTPTLELLARLRADRSFDGLRLTLMTAAAKAMCIAIPRTPSVNSRWNGDAGEIVQFGYVNLGIAVATPRGLMVPSIKDAQRLTLTELASATMDLVETARTGKTSPTALSGGTISISNVGVFGVDSGVPILNPGEAAILALGAVRRQPWEYHGEIALRDVVTLTVSFDHRIVDGEDGARFLTDVGRILSDPAIVLTMV